MGVGEVKLTGMVRPDRKMLKYFVSFSKAISNDRDCILTTMLFKKERIRLIRFLIEINEKTQKIEDTETRIMEFEEKIANLHLREKIMTEKWTVGLAELKKEQFISSLSLEDVGCPL